MFRFLALCTVLAVGGYAEEDLPILGIIGGTVAAPGQFPYQVSIEENGRHNCGGTLLTKKTILTAAHCVNGKDPNIIKIRAGSNRRGSGGQLLPLATYAVHEQFNPAPPQPYDVAIITVQGEFTLSSTVAPATLPSVKEPVYANQMATVSGWGSEFHQGPLATSLKFVQIPMWDRAKCQQYIPNLPASHFCAGDNLGHMNSCPGDSGGPLSIGNKVIGIVSFGYGCGAFFRPAVYTYVSHIRDWIKTNGGV